ncbi:diaminopimelate decarboxylase [Thermosulfidibacter takaii ABI70S6]|uniref:Diaminopimelate decarboxylase n=1 Tax=Thermosulfidibacter takaii (strain DSM 17441 / JCM 13301 / NBRC 103674 / ABI70S6) TaxID=1298851 RepID=A0A0S3QU73_THET7|nr:diaminopimelate decarboxylase [Thermosulfidibacter takaii]BAT71862.1 diaminopimelate decarboxylase [Thermosulfidibacter takaii ABI70S6]
MAFSYREGQLFCENVSLKSVADEIGTPCYIYSYSAILEGIKAYVEPLSKIGGIACYAVKANSNLAVLRSIFSQGAGADIVSGGELFRALRAGVDPRKVVYAGVGKTEEEMAYALRAGVLMFNVESEQELEVLNDVAKKEGKKAPIALRVNPDVDPQTHPYIATGLKESKFGIDVEESIEVYKEASSMSNIEVVGIHCHIGSQITKIDPFVEAVSKVLSLIDRLAGEGIKIKYMDIGGGIGIRYRDEEPPSPSQLIDAIKDEVLKRGLTLIMEPGRSVVGNAGVFLTKVLYVKKKANKTFYVVDGAMNDLARPALYNAYHEILTVQKRNGAVIADVVGPICETGDFLAKNRELPEVQRGDLLAVMSAGAYGFTMASNYNSRPRVPEVLVKNNQWYVVRERETYEDMVREERIPQFLLEA